MNAFSNADAPFDSVLPSVIDDSATGGNVSPKDSGPLHSLEILAHEQEASLGSGVLTRVPPFALAKTKMLTRDGPKPP